MPCFFFFFLIIDLYFLIPAAIAQIFNPVEGKAEIEIHPVMVEAKRRTCLIYLELYKLFCAFYSSMHFSLFLQGNSFLFLYMYML